MNESGLYHGKMLISVLDTEQCASENAGPKGGLHQFYFHFLLAS